MNQQQIHVKNEELQLSSKELLELLPYGPEFLFIDEFVEVDGQHTVARYLLRADADFYKGHFADCPLTPGVVLLEAMCQCGMVAQGLYLLARETGLENTKRYRFLVTGASVEWFEQVAPGDAILIRGQLLAWRQRRIRTDVKLHGANGTLLASAIISGMGVLWDEARLSPPTTSKAN